MKEMRLPYSLDSIKVMQIAKGVFLCPYDGYQIMNFAETDEKMLDLLMSDDIKEYLPGLPIFTGTPTSKYLQLLPSKVELGLGIPYAIRIGNGLAGFVYLDSPLFNRQIGLDEWTLDFFLFEVFRGQNIMQRALARLLAAAKMDLNIHKLYASVSKKNTKSIRILESFYFEYVQDDRSGEGSFYCCDLDTINFRSDR